MQRGSSDTANKYGYKSPGTMFTQTTRYAFVEVGQDAATIRFVDISVLLYRCIQSL